MPSATPPELPNPWGAFLVDVDRQLPRLIEIHCLGGFVATFYYDLPRPTNDLDSRRTFTRETAHARLLLLLFGRLNCSMWQPLPAGATAA